MRRLDTQCSWAFALLIFFLGQSHGQSGLSEAALDQLAERVMQEFLIPGLAVGVVHEGHVVLAKGYGVRDMRQPTPVDSATLFGIASNSKGVTATALGTLVDAGKIDWDDAVIQHIPEFQLYEPYVTRNFTIRDLLTHRSGLPLGAGDLMWWPDGNFTPAEVLAGLPHLKPVSSFRQRYAYNNMLYVVAGEVLARVSGRSWAEFIETRLFEPLGMSRCKALRSRVKGDDNLAYPHAVVDGKVQRMVIGGDDFQAAIAAAGVVCSVDQLAHWVRMHLNNGKLADGTALLSAATHDELWSAQTVQNVSARARAEHRTHFRAYGLGYGLDNYHGYKRVSHNGGLPGMVTRISIIPELKLGLIILTNQQAGGALNALTHSIFSAYLPMPKRDWVAMAKARSEQGQAEYEQQQAAAWAVANRAGPAPLPFNAYIGTYRDPWRGDVTISQQGEALILKFSRTTRLEGALFHYQDGSFIVRWHERALFADAFVHFSTDSDGAISGMTMQAISPYTDFSFDFHHLNFTKVNP